MSCQDLTGYFEQALDVAKKASADAIRNGQTRDAARTLGCMQLVHYFALKAKPERKWLVELHGAIHSAEAKYTRSHKLISSARVK